jgi:hypothetical protein
MRASFKRKKMAIFYFILCPPSKNQVKKEWLESECMPLYNVEGNPHFQGFLDSSLYFSSGRAKRVQILAQHTDILWIITPYILTTLWNCCKLIS